MFRYECEREREHKRSSKNLTEKDMLGMAREQQRKEETKKRETTTTTV